MMASTKLGVCITTKEMFGEGKPEKEGEDPWECRIFKGELVVEILEKDWLFSKEGKPLNYQLLSGPDIVKLHAELTDVSPLQEDEVHYLLAVQPPGVRLKEYLREDRKKEIMALKVEDVVMFKLDQGHNNATSIIRGKIRYIGPIDEDEGIFFGIEIIEDKYHGKGNTNGRPHFQCSANNGVYIAMDKIVQKSTYSGKQNQDVPSEQDVVLTQPRASENSRLKRTSGPSDNTRSRSGAAAVATKAKEFVGKVQQKIQGGTDVDPKPTEYKFKRGNRVVLQSIKERPITGTVRWVGPMKLSREIGSLQVIAVGIETDEKIKVKEEFPDLYLDLTGSHGQSLFTISTDHSRVYLPEQLVLHADEYALQQQKQNENEYETKLAKEYGLSVEEYRAQKDLIDEANKTKATEYEKKIDLYKTRDIEKKGERVDQMAPDPPLDHDEEDLSTGTGGGGDHRKMEDSLYMLQTGQPFSDERIELEQKHLNKFKGQQREHRQDEDYQVIETQLEQTEVEGSFIKVSQRISSQHLGNGASAVKGQASQNSSSIPVYQNLPVKSGKPGYSPNTGHNVNNLYGTPERLSYSPTPTERSPHSSLPSQPTSSNDHPAQDPSQFAIGSMVSVPTQRGDPLHGVVVWIGTLPDFPGLIAGVELDNPLTGCTDGTWQGKRFFNCPPGRAFFCPITALRLDTRYIDPGQIPAAAREDVQNPLKDLAPQFEEDDTLVTPDLFTKYIGDEHGIQGHHNSCYLDATVFGFFALSDSFDMMLLEEPNDHVGQKIKYILWKGIVNPLRKYGLAKHESVMELRNSLEEFGRMKGANKDEKDPEEFLNLLFKEILHVKPFLSIKRPFGVEKEYFIQLFFEIDPQQNELPETEKLIAQMFHEQKISFTNVPSKLLLQMPRFGKDFKMYNRIIPSLTINVKPLLDPSARGTQKCHFCLSSTATTICYNCPKDVYNIDEPYVFYCNNCCENAHKIRKSHHCEDVELKQDIGDARQISKLELLSVICIETSHYVCYTRSQNRWLFHDSMANRLYDMYNIPRVVDVTEDLKDWVYNPDNRQKLKDSPAKSIPEYVRRFTQDIYMCVYVNTDLDLYGEAGDPTESLQGGGHSQYGGQQSGRRESTV